MTERGGLEGRVALVTGASHGIGLAIARALASEGASVGMVARDPAALEQEVGAINEKHAGRALAMVTDVADEPGMRDAFQRLAERFGRLDIVFANAGTNRPTGPLSDMAIADWFSIFQTNVLGVALTCQLATAMMGPEGGNIITMGSGIGREGAKRNSAYAASKGASWILTRSLALELIDKNILVNELIPGPVATRMNPGAEGARWKRPEDIVPLALYLATLGPDGPTGQSFNLMRR